MLDDSGASTLLFKYIFQAAVSSRFRKLHLEGMLHGGSPETRGKKKRRDGEREREEVVVTVVHKSASHEVLLTVLGKM